MMDELKFFLGFQIKQLKDGTFISQTKYTNDMLKKFDMNNTKPIKTPMPSNGHLDLNEEGKSEGPIRRTREGGSEWEPIKILLEGDRNSNKMNKASNTRLRLSTQVGQAHVATGVPLDLGTNTQLSDPRTQRNNKPRVYRPTPVRPVSTTGQTGPCW
jgi:hypothetical protein